MAKRDVQQGVKKMREKVKQTNNLLAGANKVWEDTDYDTPYTEAVVTEYMKQYPKG